MNTPETLPRCHNCHRPAVSLERSLIRLGDMHSKIEELPTCRTCRCERYSRRGIPRDQRPGAGQGITTKTLDQAFTPSPFALALHQWPKESAARR
jgi:hypothetical protein